MPVRGAPTGTASTGTPETPDLSVVVNTLNRPDWLDGALRSLVSERAGSDPETSAPRIEILVVDQSRDDRSQSIAHKLPVRYVRHAGEGLASSRNIGIALARAPWVAFIDDDARVRPGWARTLLAATHPAPGNAHPSALAGRVVDLEDGSLHFSNGAIHADGRHLSVRPLESERLRGAWYATGMGTNMAFHRETLLRIGGFDPFYRYFHDESDVFLRIARAGGKTGYLDDLIVDHAFAPSDLRNSRVDFDYGPIARSQLYFSWKHRPATGTESMRHLFSTLFSRKSPLRLVLRRTRRGRLPLLRGIAQLGHIFLGFTSAVYELADRPRKDVSDDRFDLHDSNEIEAPALAGLELDSPIQFRR